MDDDAADHAFTPEFIASLDRSAADARAGRTVPLATVLRDLDESIARTRARLDAEAAPAPPSL